MPFSRMSGPERKLIRQVALAIAVTICVTAAIFVPYYFIVAIPNRGDGQKTEGESNDHLQTAPKPPPPLPLALPSVQPSEVPSIIPSSSSQPSTTFYPSSTPSSSPWPTISSQPSSLASSVPSDIPSVIPSQLPSEPSPSPIAVTPISVDPAGTEKTTAFPSMLPTDEFSPPSQRPSQTPSSLPSPLSSAPPTVSHVLFSSTFETGTEEFVFRPDTFRATSGSTTYAKGLLVNTESSGGALQVELGGVDDNVVQGISGGWERSFLIDDETAHWTLFFQFQLNQSATYDETDLSQVLVSLDGTTLLGQEPYDYVSQLVGDGDSGIERTTGWKAFHSHLGTLSVGSHTLVFGGFNNEKSDRSEVTYILLDDIRLEKTDPPEDPTLGPQRAISRLTVEQFTANIFTLANFGDREQGSGSYDSAATWVQTELEAVGYRVERHFYSYEGALRNSMFVTKVGTLYPDRMFIVSAHLDGRGGGGGADDDASGSSLVLEMARMLGAADIATEVSVRLIFWNNEETGLNGSEAYASTRDFLQGKESPVGSNSFPEPTWLGLVQHDMILFDHGLPVQVNQIAAADADIEYQAASVFAEQSLMLANALLAGNQQYAKTYPAEVSSGMSNTDSVSFMELMPSVSLRENRRTDEIGNGSQPNWHQPTDVFATYSAEDFLFGFNILLTTAGTISQLVGLKVTSVIDI